MSLFSRSERLVRMDNFPYSSQCFQAPAFAKFGNDLFVSYYVESDDGFYKCSPNDIHMIDHLEEQAHVIIHFENTAYFLSDTYEDDTLSQHRYSSLGLEKFTHYEVYNSEIVHNLLHHTEKSRIKQHTLAPTLRHHILVLHGYVLEMVSSKFTLYRKKGSILSSINHIMKHASVSNEEVDAL